MKYAVYRTWLLPYSETFIRNQFAAIPYESRIMLGCHVLSTPPTPYRSLGRGEALLFKSFRRSKTLSASIGPNDVIIAHFAQDGWRIARVAEKARVPLYVYCHGSDVLTEFQKLRKRGPSFAALVRNWPHLVDQATNFFAASRFIASRLECLGVPKEKIRVQYVGVPTATLAGRDWAGVPKLPRLLFVGRLVENKGIDDLLRAFTSLIQPAIPAATLTVVGDGPLGLVLRRTYSSDRIRFLGVRSYSEVRAILTKQYVVVAPSRAISDGSSEGLNQVVLEAQANGLPVVVNRTGGMPEAVHPSNEIVEPRAIDDLARACIVALGDELAWSDESAKRREDFVRDRFDLITQTRSLLQWIEASR